MKLLNNVVSLLTKTDMNENESELDKWKDVAKKLNLALIHCFSWIGCDECPETKYCEECQAQLDIMEDAIKEYNKIIKENDESPYKKQNS